MPHQLWFQPLQRMRDENRKRSSKSHCWHRPFVQVYWDNTRVSTSMITSCLVTRNKEDNYQATRSNCQATNRWTRTKEACLSPLTQDRCAALDWEQCFIWKLTWLSTMFRCQPPLKVGNVLNSAIHSNVMLKVMFEKLRNIVRGMYIAYPNSLLG